MDSKHKFIKVMFDYSATGVWAQEGYPLDAEELPISPSLMIKIERWNDAYSVDYDKTFNFDMIRHSRELTEAEKEQESVVIKNNELHYLKAAFIAAELKEQLPDFDIVLFEETKDIYPIITDLVSDEYHCKIIPMGFKNELIRVYPQHSLSHKALKM